MDPAIKMPSIRKDIRINSQLGRPVRDILVKNGILRLSERPRKLDVVLLNKFIKEKTPSDIGGLKTRGGESSTAEIMAAVCGRLMAANNDNFYVIPLPADAEIIDLLVDFSRANKDKHLGPLYFSFGVLMAQLYVRCLEKPGCFRMTRQHVGYLLHREVKDRPDIRPFLPLANQIADLFNRCFVAHDGTHLVTSDRACETVQMTTFGYDPERKHRVPK